MFAVIKRIFLFLLLGITQVAWAQMPAGCANPPAPYTNEGGDFDISVGGLVSDNFCIPIGVPTINAVFIQKSDPLLGGTLPTNTLGYAFDVKNTLSTSDFSPNASQTITNSGDYWIAQIGTAGATGYIRCKKIKVHKVQPVDVSMKICGASTVTITIPAVSQNPTNNHNRYAINWNDGSSPIEYRTASTAPIVVTRAFLPTNPIRVTGEYLDDNGNVFCTSVASDFPLPTNKIYITGLETKENKTDHIIKFNNFVPLTNYKVSYSSDGGVTWQEDPNNHINGNALITGLDPQINYCFRISYQNSCGIPDNTNVVCSIKLNGDVKSSTDVDLNWDLPKFPSGILSKNEVEWKILGCSTPNCSNILPSNPLTNTNYLFTSLNCSNKYSFQANTLFFVNFDGNNIIVSIKSNTVEIDPSTSAKPPAPTSPLVVSYVNRNEIFVNSVVNGVPFPSYNFYRAPENSTNFELVSSSTNNYFQDTNIDPNVKSYCYKYEYVDACGRVSEQSDAYCSIFLNSQSSGNINWTPFALPNLTLTTPPFYDIYFTNPSTGTTQLLANTFGLTENIQSVIDLYPNAPELTFTIVANVEFQFDPTQLPNRFTVSSNPYTLVFASEMLLPSAFTPNNDDINDKFHPELRFITNGEMQIYDRWGSLLFETEDLDEGWDGHLGSNFEEVPAGNYIYKIRAIDKDNKVYFKTGTITLIR